MQRILFVCTGNTCRSPLAEYLLRYKAGNHFEVKSAGVAAVDGQSASKHVSDLLEQMEIPVSHLSRMITPELMGWADLVLTMTSSHQHWLVDRFPEHVNKVYPLKEYVIPEQNVPDILDPFGSSLEVYRATMREMENLLDKLVNRRNDVI